MIENKDYKMLEKCTAPNATRIFSSETCEHPLDPDVIALLNTLKSKIDDNSDDFRIFKFREELIDPLWKMLIEKAIKCLRYYDKREPFLTQNGNKVPKAYGIDDIKKYYDKYTDFERILYGSNRYYRDHVVHVFRTWLSGVVALVINNGTYLNKIKLHEKDINVELSKSEKLSIWTIIALTHDLGYPLQKAKSIIDTTQSMVSTFISNPDISMDFSFRGVQNYMNDFIVRLMSSKMIKSKAVKQNTGRKIQMYVARLQPKYYFKFQKSLEENQHGILSTLIIYKLLTYFLESDFNINEDYHFDPEDSRQFYIRREILRSIASHTCDDVYQLYMTSFSFLLRICDDTQEWGRKNISELYVKSSKEYNLKDIALTFDNTNQLYTCIVDEEFILSDEPDSVISLLNRLREQSLVYVTIFRDGQDTALRDFSFERKLSIKYSEITLTLILKIPKDNASELVGTIQYVSDGDDNEKFGLEFFQRIKDFDNDAGLYIISRNGGTADLENFADWKTGTFAILLSK